MSALQATLLCRTPSPSSSTSVRTKLHPFRLSSRRGSALSNSVSFSSRRLRGLLTLRACSSASDSVNPTPDSGIDQSFNPKPLQQTQGTGGLEDWVTEASNGRGVVLEFEGTSHEVVDLMSGTIQVERKVLTAAFLGGWFAASEKWVSERGLLDWRTWLPFWRHQKRLEKLISDADANPKDATKQSALLAELNKHSPESVIQRFEQRDHAVDSKAVAEYLRALVVTNAISEYLADEKSGKSSSLPALDLSLHFSI